MKEWFYHGITGNAATEEQVGITRGIVAAALAEVVALIVGVIPMDIGMENYVLSHTGAIVIFASFVLYGYLDKWLKERGIKK